MSEILKELIAIMAFVGALLVMVSFMAARKLDAMGAVMP